MKTTDYDDFKRWDSDRGTFMAKRVINENTYVVIGYPESKKHTIVIYAKSGDNRMPDHPYEVGEKRGWKKMAGSTTYATNRDFNKRLSKTLNEAICRFESKLEQEESFRDNVDSILEANKEVHEDIDYQLEHNT